MKHYKWLTDLDGTPPFQNDFRWPMPNGKPGAWVEAEGSIVLCENGVHACRADQVAGDYIRSVLTEIELDGEVVEGDDKVAAQRGRIVRVVDAWDDRTARIFAADCADRALERAGVEDGRCWAATKAARRYANGDIDDEALSAALSVALSVAESAALSAARSAAGDAARYAAWDAAWDAARSAAWSAAWSAESAAWSAAWDAEREWQSAHLLTLVSE